MNKILILLILPLIFSSCNGQEKKTISEPNNETNIKLNSNPVKNSDGTIAVDEIKLNQNLDKILNQFNLTKNDNFNEYYNLNLDYEEFSFDANYKYKYNAIDIGKINSLMIYYLKKESTAFCFELEIENNPNCKKIISELNKNFGKNTFYKKSENTKARPIFIDENGEPKTDHIIEELTKWNDIKNHSTYYVIYKENFTTKEEKLTIIAISNISKKFDEWISYRSLNMVFD